MWPATGRGGVDVGLWWFVVVLASLDEAGFRVIYPYPVIEQSRFRCRPDSADGGLLLAVLSSVASESPKHVRSACSGKTESCFAPGHADVSDPRQAWRNSLNKRTDRSGAARSHNSTRANDDGVTLPHRRSSRMLTCTPVQEEQQRQLFGAARVEVGRDQGSVSAAVASIAGSTTAESQAWCLRRRSPSRRCRHGQGSRGGGRPNVSRQMLGGSPLPPAGQPALVVATASVGAVRSGFISVRELNRHKVRTTLNAD
ncbi:hypothetical protein ON010_g15233 [Phytophthora cinnamomi]|nr:hypothetical protein ON010_g15233 [Phytophthora cinnamomi]